MIGVCQCDAAQADAFVRAHDFDFPVALLNAPRGAHAVSRARKCRCCSRSIAMAASVMRYRAFSIPGNRSTIFSPNCDARMHRRGHPQGVDDEDDRNVLAQGSAGRGVRRVRWVSARCRRSQAPLDRPGKEQRGYCDDVWPCMSACGEAGGTYYGIMPNGGPLCDCCASE